MNNNFESRWSQMDKRLNLQSIGEFIQHGSDITEINKHNRVHPQKAVSELRKVEKSGIINPYKNGSIVQNERNKHNKAGRILPR